MKKIIVFALAVMALVGCENDDTDFSAYINGTASTADVIYIDYNGTTVSVTGDKKDTSLPTGLTSP